MYILSVVGVVILGVIVGTAISAPRYNGIVDNPWGDEQIFDGPQI